MRKGAMRKVAMRKDAMRKDAIVSGKMPQLGDTILEQLAGRWRKDSEKLK